MAFRNKKYEADSGDIHPIRISSGYEAFVGAEPSGDIDNNIKAKVTKTNREFGLRPRLVVVSRTVGTGANTFKRYARIPMLTQQAYDDFAVPVTINGNQFDTLVGKEPEDF